MPDQVRVCGDEMRYKLPELCNIQYGYAFDSKNFTEDDTYPPLIRIRDVKRGYSETFYAGDYPQEYIVHAGDLLIGMDGEFNIARWNSRDALLNQRVCKITAKEGNNEEYIRFALSKVLKIIENKTSFVTVKHLSAKELNKIELSIPVELEQNKIACILKNIENIINIRQRQLEKLSEIVRARFVEMFGTPYENEKGFPLLTVDDVIEFTGGAQPDKKYFEYESTEENIRLIQIRDYKTDNYITYIPKSMAKRFCDADAIMIGRYGPPIFQILKGIEGAYNVALMKATPKMGNKEFIRYFLKQECLFKYLDNLSQRTAGQSGIEMSALKAYPFPYPPIELQEEFEKIAKQVDKSKDSVQKALDEAQLLFDSLMQQYFG